jgi:hypothetical protein
MSAIKTTLQSTITSYLAALDGAFAARSTAAIDATKTADCTFSLAPASFLRAAGLPPDLAMPNGAWNAHLQSQFGAVRSVRVELLGAPVVDEAARAAVVHHRNHVVLADGREATLENAVFLYFSEDGTRVARIVEFTDPVATKEYMAMIEEAKKELGESA